MTLRLLVWHVDKGYNGDRVLRDCSFAFNEHGIYVLTGSNGCGKSTFLRICALIELPDSGEVNYFSDDMLLPRDLELRRKITLVLPRVGVFNTSVFKNVAHGLWIRGIRGQRRKMMLPTLLSSSDYGIKKIRMLSPFQAGRHSGSESRRALVIT